MIYCTGDTHGNWNRFSTDIFPEQKEMTRDDFVIICGDFGLWADTKEEKYWLDWLNDKPFTTLFIDGNHENFSRLNNEFEVVGFHGGKAHKVRDNIQINPLTRQTETVVNLEAKIQRLPDLFDSSQSAGIEYESANGKNRRFGRRFRILSFKFL